MIACLGYASLMSRSPEMKYRIPFSVEVYIPGVHFSCIHHARNKKVNTSTKRMITKYEIRYRILRRERIENIKKTGISRIKIFATGKLIRFIPYMNLNENNNHPRAKDRHP
jgi:hypothetical protein